MAAWTLMESPASFMWKKPLMLQSSFRLLNHHRFPPLSCPQDELLASCPYFAVIRQQITSPRQYNGDAGSFHALMCVEGQESFKRFRKH